MTIKRMTEDEWQHTTDPIAMMQFLQRKLRNRTGTRPQSWRTMRLFTCAIAAYNELDPDVPNRIVPDPPALAPSPPALAQLPPLPAHVSRKAGHAIALAESMALSDSIFFRCNKAIRKAYCDVRDECAYFPDRWHPTSRAIMRRCFGAMLCSQRKLSCHDVLCDFPSFDPDILREITGNIFRPPVSMANPPHRNSPLVQNLAQAAIDSRQKFLLDNARLLVLSDALEETGSLEQDRLDHLRLPQRHFSGCWGVCELLTFPSHGLGACATAAAKPSLSREQT